MDVEDRSVIEGDADRPKLQGKRAGEALRELDVAAPPERRHRRPLSERRFQPRDGAALLIDADPQGQIWNEARGLVAHLRHLRGLGDVPGKQDHAAQPELARERLQLDRQTSDRRIRR